MEDISDILILVLAAAGMIISAITKSVKKKAQDRKSPSDFDQWAMDEEDKREMGETIVAYNVEDPYEQEQTYWSYDKEAIKHLETSVQVDDANREHKHHVVDDNAYRIDDNKTAGSVGTRILKDGVNLREAIIYTELLKPKFEEY